MLNHRYWGVEEIPRYLSCRNISVRVRAVLGQRTPSKLPVLVFHQVKVLFVRNLATPVTEELLEKTFSQFGKLERVKKLKDYAFVHFEDRDAAVKVSTGVFYTSLEYACYVFALCL